MHEWAGHPKIPYCDQLVQQTSNASSKCFTNISNKAAALTHGHMMSPSPSTALRTSGSNISCLLSCRLLRRMVPLKPTDLHSTAQHSTAESCHPLFLEHFGVDVQLNAGPATASECSMLLAGMDSLMSASVLSAHIKQTQVSSIIGYQHDAWAAATARH
jgi:hypothetical protein